MHVSSSRLPLLACGAFALALAASACSSSSSPDTTMTHDSGATVDVGVPPIIIVPKVDAGGKPDATAPVEASVDAGSDVLPPPTDAELNTYPAYMPPVPQVQNGGGPVLTNPVFIPVVFAGDPLLAQIQAFTDAIGPSMYWEGAVSEYGVGAGTASPPIVVDETMPSIIDDSQLQTWLANKIGTDPRFGALGPSVFDAGGFDAGPVDATAPLSDADSKSAKIPSNAVYILYLPTGTNVTLDGARSCGNGGFGGYHGDFAYAPTGASVVYATLPRCSGGGGESEFQVLTSSASHELAEATTDPYQGQPAYSSVDADHFFWEILYSGGELADMCEDLPGAFYNPAEPSMSGFLVQRIWSNKAAMAGLDPCVPSLPAAAEPVYFNAFPNLGQVLAQYNGFQFQTLGVEIGVGQSQDVELDLFSNTSTKGQEWGISLIDGNSFFGGGSPDLTFSPAVLDGTNGDKLSVTITNTGTDGQGARPFVVINSLGATQTWWIGVVIN